MEILIEVSDSIKTRGRLEANDLVGVPAQSSSMPSLKIARGWSPSTTAPIPRLGLAGRTELAHQDDIQGRAESVRNRARDRKPAARNAQHYHIVTLVGEKRAGQSISGTSSRSRSTER